MQRYANGNTPISEIAEELNVETVMEGSVRYSGDRVRIAANVIDPATGASRWSEVYDRELVNVLDIQEDIAANIAAALGEKFFPINRQGIHESATTSPEAASLYLKVLGLRREFSFNSATQHLYLDQALDFDPKFANAYALKAVVYAGSFSDRADGRGEHTDLAALQTLALKNAKTALELDPSAARAYQAIANVDRVHWRWSDALRNYAKAYELSPNDLDAVGDYAGFLSSIGNHEQAIELMERAVQLDPASPTEHFSLGVALAEAGRTSSAAAVLRKAALLAPDRGHIHHWLGRMEARLGDLVAALGEAQDG